MDTDEAMIVIQEASSAIAKISQELSGFEEKQKEVVEALKDISNRISNLESDAAATDRGRSSSRKVKPPLYVRVRMSVVIILMSLDFALQDKD